MLFGPALALQVYGRRSGRQVMRNQMIFLLIAVSQVGVGLIDEVLLDDRDERPGVKFKAAVYLAEKVRKELAELNG